MKYLVRVASAILLFVTTSCEKTSPVVEPFDGTTADMVLPEGFEFDMTRRVDIQILGEDVATDITKVEVFRNFPETASLPSWATLNNSSLPNENQVVLRKTDEQVYVRLNYSNGFTHTFTLPIVDDVITVELAPFTLATYSGKTTTTACTDSLANGGGFGTRIDSVVEANGDYTITITVFHNGCGGPSCKELSHYSIEVDPTNTVSNVSWDNFGDDDIEGDIKMSLGNNDPFDGFKLDDTEGIGDGQSGKFTITYTLDTLQDQQFLAKAGNNYTQIAAFDSTDFACILNRNSTGGGGGGGTPPSQDTDGDGVDDTTDEFPNDPNLAYVIISDTASFVAEDNWPYVGDFDFNDLVLPYYYKAYVNGDNELVEFRYFYKILARGAKKDNGFGFSLQVDPSEASVTGYNHTEGYISLDGNGAESGSSTELNVICEDLVWNKMPSYNTIPGAARNEDEFDSVRVQFANGVDLNVHLSYNPFIILDKRRGLEVHEINHAPTFKADQNYFGYGVDASNASTETYYQQSNGLPWVLNIPGEFKYPYEQVDITEAYANFANWAQSGGTSNTDWYDNSNPNNIDATKIYPN